MLALALLLLAAPARAMDEVLPEGLAAMESNALVAVSPPGCDLACVRRLSTTRGFMSFSPRSARPRSVGVIYYPGGDVDPRGYAPTAQYLARRGWFTAIVPFPLELAIVDPLRGREVIDAHPEIEYWVVGGHSLGGVASAKLVIDSWERGEDNVKGFFNLASIIDQADDMSDLEGLKVIYTYATRDRLPRELYEADMPKMPPATSIFVPLVGANHGWAGWVPPLDGDIEPAELVSHWQESDLFAASVAWLCEWVEAGDIDVPQAQDFVPAEDATESCLDLVAADRHQFTLEKTPNFLEFQACEATGRTVCEYVAQMPNPAVLTAPPVVNAERFCKLPAGTMGPESCSSLSAAAPDLVAGDDLYVSSEATAFAYESQRLVARQSVRPRKRTVSAAVYETEETTTCRYFTGPQGAEIARTGAGVCINAADKSCTSYDGAGWTPFSAAQQCADEFVPGRGCPQGLDTIGFCRDTFHDTATETLFYRGRARGTTGVCVVTVDPVPPVPTSP